MDSELVKCMTIVNQNVNEPKDRRNCVEIPMGENLARIPQVRILALGGIPREVVHWTDLRLRNLVHEEKMIERRSSQKGKEIVVEEEKMTKVEKGKRTKVEKGRKKGVEREKRKRVEKGRRTKVWKGGRIQV